MIVISQPVLLRNGLLLGFPGGLREQPPCGCWLVLVDPIRFTDHTVWGDHAQVQYVLHFQQLHALVVSIIW